MTRLGFILIVCLLFVKYGIGQVVFGTDNYIEYSVGKLPILISVPHGGHLSSTFIPDRKCNNPTTVVDANTIDLALKIDSIFKVKTGCSAHIVICNLRRTKIDANRNISDGTCGNPIAVIAWYEFHHFIDSARSLIYKEYVNKAFYFDLHGHGNSIQRIELGYLLRDDDLELHDSTLNQTRYVDQSSIQNLVNHNPQKLSLSALVRGTNAFGSLLENHGYPTVPSQNTPNPGLSSNYFSGGYNTSNHTCFNPNLIINGVQVECNFSNVRDTEKNRIVFAEAFVLSVLEYMQLHFEIDLTKCATESNTSHPVNPDLKIYPTILQKHHKISINHTNQNVEILWMDMQGRIVTKQNIYDGELTIPKSCVSGMYFIQIIIGNQRYLQKVILVD